MKLKRRGMRKSIALLPNLLTTANLFCGFFSITKSLHGDYVFAAWMVILASIFDGLDGRVARMTNTQSDFGVEYDSLSDLTTFCMAPAILMYNWALVDFGKLAIAACFLFFACGALRLARFNTQSDGLEKENFQGLPTPPAGCFACSYLIFYSHIFGEGANPSLLVMGMMVGLAFLMVSNVKYKAFKKVKRASFFFLVCAVGVVFIVAAQPEIMFFVIGLIYLTSGIIEWIWKSPEKIRNAKDLIQRFFQEKKRDSEYYDNDAPLDDDELDISEVTKKSSPKNIASMSKKT